MLLALFAFASCSKDESDNKEIVLTGGTTTTQTVYADQTSGVGNGIKFNATARWTATVSAIAGKSGGSDLDWLALNAYSGGAGEHTLIMTLKENTTGADRKAQISIVCGGTTIRISVEQKGTTQNGDKPETIATYITPEGKIAGGEILGENQPTELKWIMMRMDDTSVDYYSPTSYPYTGKTFDITLPTPSDNLLGAFVADYTNTTDFTIVPGNAKFSHSALNYDGGALSLTNLSWQDKTNQNYKMKKGDGYVEFIYASKAVTVNGTIIGEFDQPQTFHFTNCTFRQGWNEMVMIAAEDAAADGSVTINATTNNAPSTFRWIAQNNNFDPGPGLRQVSQITIFDKDDKEDFTQNITFLYDAQSRMTEAKTTLVGVSEADFLEKCTWVYNGNTVKYKQDFLERGDNETYFTTTTTTLNLNVDGTVKTVTGKRITKQNGTLRDTYDFTETYTYTDGFLAQHDQKGNGTSGNGTTYTNDQKRVITWKDGNIMREDVAKDRWYAKYEYNGAPHKQCNIDIAFITRQKNDMSIIPLNLGKRSQNLIAKMTEYSGVVVNDGVEGKEDYSDYTYEFDNMGFIVKINEITDSGSQSTMVITYKN